MCGFMYKRVPFAPGLVVPSKEWHALLQDLSAIGVKDADLTALFHKLCKSTDLSLGTIDISKLLSDQDEVWGHFFRIILKRHTRGKGDRILFEDFVRQVSGFAELDFFDLVKRIAMLYRKLEATDILDVQNLYVQLYAGRPQPRLGREILRRLLAEHPVHNWGALAHAAIRYPCLAVPLVYGQRAVQKLYFGAKIWDKHFETAGKAIFPPSMEVLLADAITARTIMLESVSHAAVPLLFGTGKTMVEGVVIAHAAPALSESSMLASIAGSVVAPPVQSPPAPCHRRHQGHLSKPTGLDVASVHSSLYDGILTADKAMADGELSARPSQFSPDHSLAPLVVGSPQFLTPYKLGPSSAQLATESQLMAASMIPNFKSTVEVRAGVEALRGAALMHVVKSKEQKLQERKALRQALPGKDLSKMSMMPTSINKLNVFVADHPPPDTFDKTATSAQLAKQVLEHTSTWMATEKFAKRPHAPCLLCHKPLRRSKFAPLEHPEKPAAAVQEPTTTNEVHVDPPAASALPANSELQKEETHLEGTNLELKFSTVAGDKHRVVVWDIPPVIKEEDEGECSTRSATAESLKGSNTDSEQLQLPGAVIEADASDGAVVAQDSAPARNEDKVAPAVTAPAEPSSGVVIMQSVRVKANATSKRIMSATQVADTEQQRLVDISKHAASTMLSTTEHLDEEYDEEVPVLTDEGMDAPETAANIRVHHDRARKIRQRQALVASKALNRAIEVEASRMAVLSKCEDAIIQEMLDAKKAEIEANCEREAEEVVVSGLAEWKTAHASMFTKTYSSRAGIPEVPYQIELTTNERIAQYTQQLLEGTLRRDNSKAAPLQKAKVSDIINEAIEKKDNEFFTQGFCDPCWEYTRKALVAAFGFKFAEMLQKCARIEPPRLAEVEKATADAKRDKQSLVPRKIDKRTGLPILTQFDDDEWLEIMDDRSKKWFYHNIKTGESIWTPPKHYHRVFDLE
jgi:hypothetical protein